jgi:hypothetical protein
MAAGLGFKTFTTGEVLTAGDVNGYLMQGVLVFASEAARNSAITSPQEGQFAYTKDNNSLWYYTGSAWAASGATGDIEGVTAGVGITGGGTSGTVTITNDMATTITASGDLVVGTGSGTYDNLPIGTTGQILTADTTVSPYKVKWATPAGGGGKVLQVVSTTKTDAFTTTSTSYVDVTGYSVTITPSASTSKILIMYDINVNTDPATHDGRSQLMRDSTAIKIGDASGSQPRVTIQKVSANYYNDLTGQGGTFLDSPATTSAVTYKIQVQKFGGVAGDILCVNRTEDDTSSRPRGACTITVMEIGA